MDDVISRKAAINTVHNMRKKCDTDSIDDYEEMLAVALGELCTAERTGRWIDHAGDGYVECPFCHSATNCDDNISDLHFCFSCGARLEGER